MARIYKQVIELGNIITGKTPSTADNNLWDGAVPFITPTDINGYDTFYQTCTERTISDSGVKKQKNTLLPKDSVCITCIGSTIGKSCLTKVPSITNQQINSIIPNAANDNRYILYLLRYNLPYMQMIGGGSGSGTPIISKNKFARFKFLVEDNLPIQQKIASILSTYDTLIENNTKRIRLLEQMAENLYKEWFVRFRFPGHENVEMENGLPKGWKMSLLTDLFNFQEGPGIRNWQYVEDNGIKFINIRCINNGDVNTESANMISTDEANGKYKHFLLKENDIVMSCSGSLGRCSIIRKCHLPLCLNTSVIRFWPKFTDDFSFLHGYLTSKDFINKQREMASGSAQVNFGPMHLKKMKLLVPKVEVRKKYQDIVFSIIEEQNRLRDLSNFLTRQRDLLLPRLMSGKLEVQP